MRKIFLSVFIFLVGFTCSCASKKDVFYFEGADFNFKLSPKVDFQKLEKSVTTSNVSSYLHFNGFDVKGAWKTSKLSFSDEFCAEKPAFGAFLNFGDLSNFPLTVGFGNLNFSGAVSKLKNPYLSMPSQFSFSSLGVAPISMYMPANSGIKKSLAAAFKYNLSHKNGVLQNFYTCGFYDGNRSAISISSKLNLGKNAGLNFCAASLYEEVINKNSSWYGVWSIFNKTNLLSSLFQCSLNLPNKNFRVSMFLYESPHGTPDLCISLENSFKIGHFSMNAGGFYSFNDYIFTSGGTPLKTVGQIMLNPQMNVFLCRNTLRLSFGSFVFCSQKVKNDGTFYLNTKSGTSVELNSKKMTFGADLKILNLNMGTSLYNFFENPSFNNGDFLFTLYYLHKNAFYPKFKLCCGFPKDFEYNSNSYIKIGTSLQPLKNKKTKLFLNSDLKFNAGDNISCNFTLGGNLKIKTKYASYSASCNFSCKF